jgi:hypothetical protein
MNEILFHLVSPLGLNLFDWLIPNGYYIFTFIVFSNNPYALFYIVWIHGMETKQYGIKNLVVIQLQSNCNSSNYNLVIQASLISVRYRPKLIIYLV